jgi:hypothetical protein
MSSFLEKRCTWDTLAKGTVAGLCSGPETALVDLVVPFLSGPGVYGGGLSMEVRSFLS